MYSVKEYYKFAKNIYGSRGLKAMLKEGLSYTYESFIRAIEPIIKKDSEYVLDKEWDVLIILDGCRVDLIEEVANEYDFIEKPPHNTIWSADSYSEGWLEQNFTGDKYQQHKENINNLVHVTGNPFTDSVCDKNDFLILDEVWRYGWDNEKGYIPPSIITDRAIHHYRQEKPKQMIVHYMQPHAPFISENNTDYKININNFANSVSTQTPWDLYRDSVMSKEELWGAYKDTLHVALKSVEKLLNNIDAEKVIISSDHGNAMGEWGIYGHPRHIQIPVLRNVPWITTTANNIENYTPEKYIINEDLNRESQLEALGYK